MSMTIETLYLRLHDEIRRTNEMETRLRMLEDFIQSKYPGELSPSFVGDQGELGTAPDLNAIEIVYGEPEEGDASNAEKTG